MKIRLQLLKDKSPLLESVYDVSDAESFGLACADAFSQLRSKELNQATSVGAMMDMLNQNVLEVLHGASIAISKA